MNQSSLKTALYNWLSVALGTQHVFTITFDADLITGNLINGSFNGTAIAQVSFDTDHDATIEAFALAIQKLAVVFKAEVTDNREITCTALTPGVEIEVTGLLVTGGISQAVATVATVTEPVAIPVIFSEQNAPRPSPYPYATLRVDSFIKLGWDETRSMDDNGIATIGGQRRATVSVHYFGTDPFTQITQAYSSLQKQTVRDAFSAAGIAIIQLNDIQNATTMLETAFEPHTTFDFFVGLADNVEDDLGIIEAVEVTGQVGDVVVGPNTIQV